EGKKDAKGVARSAYFPVLRNDTSGLKVTDTQFIGIPAGALGTAAGTAIPDRTVVLNQGGRSFFTSGTGLTQPVTQLFKIKAANDVAAADVNAAQSKTQQTENQIVLRIHQIYYRILIAQAHREAVAAKATANEAMESERIAQVRQGSALQEEAIESK